MSRGIKWLIAGVVLFVISYIINSAANGYVNSSGLGLQMFARIQEMNVIFSIAAIARIAAIAAAAAGGVMYIVDSSPKRKVGGV